jgi:hypothetical protein
MKKFGPRPNTEIAHNRQEARAEKGKTFVAWQTEKSVKHVEDC